MANLSSNSTVSEIYTMAEPGRILLITLGVIITTMGIPGNILTIVAIVKCKPLRTRLNIFIVNLCISDVIVVGYLYPFVILDLILGHHPVSLLWCKLNLVVMNVMSPTAFVIIMLITISRYVKIIHENKFEKLFSMTNTLIVCVIAWIPGIILAIVTATDLSKLIYVPFNRTCLADVKVTLQKTNLFIAMVSMAYISSIVCYLRIWLWLRNHERQLLRHGHDVFSKMKLHSNRKQLTMSFLIVLLYICMTMPGLVVFAIRVEFSMLFNSITVMLYFGNSSLNCIVYGAMHKSVRRYYQRLLPNVWFNRVQPTSGS